MKVEIFSLSKTSVGKRDLPVQFQEPIRPDLIKKAVEVLHANIRQPYGAFPEAGKRPSAKLSRRRRKYRGSYGIGISRVPRKIMSRRGTRFNWVGAFAPGMVGGRRSHPPKAMKQWVLKINKKENRKAIRSALAATMVKELVEQRGHILPPHYPFLIEAKLEQVKKTKQLRDTLEKLGLKQELERTGERKIRAGKGKWRGRKYRVKNGVLLVVSQSCSAIQAAKNIPGLDIAVVDTVNAALLAPGAEVGRLTFFTDKALERLEKEHLFMNISGKKLGTAPKKETKSPAKKQTLRKGA